MSNLRLVGYDVYFPYPKPLASQMSIMTRMLMALKEKSNSLLESPTGTGKTLALLCTALAYQHRCRSDKIIADIEKYEIRLRELEQFLAEAERNHSANMAAYKDSERSAGSTPPPGIPLQSLETFSRVASSERKMKESLALVSSTKAQIATIKSNLEYLRVIAVSGRRPSAVKVVPGSDEDRFQKFHTSYTGPVIYYTARTHSQLAQVIKELEKLPGYVDSTKKHDTIPNYIRSLYTSHTSDNQLGSIEDRVGSKASTLTDRVVLSLEGDTIDSGSYLKSTSVDSISTLNSSSPVEPLVVPAQVIKSNQVHESQLKKLLEDSLNENGQKMLSTGLITPYFRMSIMAARDQTCVNTKINPNSRYSTMINRLVDAKNSSNSGGLSKTKGAMSVTDRCIAARKTNQCNFVSGIQKLSVSLDNRRIWDIEDATVVGCGGKLETREKISSCGSSCNSGCSSDLNSKSSLNGISSGDLSLQPKSLGGKRPQKEIQNVNQLGKDVIGCPFYASRTLLDTATIVFLPYQYVLEPAIRKSMNIDLKNSILIVDEAHNVDEACREAASFSMPLSTMIEARNSFLKYLSNPLHGCEEEHRFLLSLIENLIAWTERAFSEMSTKNDGRLQAFNSSSQGVGQFSRVPSDDPLVPPGYLIELQRGYSSSGGGGGANSFGGIAGRQYQPSIDVNTSAPVYWEGSIAVDILAQLGLSLANLSRLFSALSALSELRIAVSSSGSGSGGASVAVDGGAEGLVSATSMSFLEGLMGAASFLLNFRADTVVLPSSPVESQQPDLLDPMDEPVPVVAPYIAEGNNSSFYRLVLRWDTQLSGGNTAFVRTASDVYEPTLSLWCMSASVAFAEVAASASSVVLASGTLSPLEATAAELGIPFLNKLAAPSAISTVPGEQALAPVVAEGWSEGLLSLRLDQTFLGMALQWRRRELVRTLQRAPALLLRAVELAAGRHTFISPSNSNLSDINQSSSKNTPSEGIDDAYHIILAPPATVSTSDTSKPDLTKYSNVPSLHRRQGASVSSANALVNFRAAAIRPFFEQETFYDDCGNELGGIEREALLDRLCAAAAASESFTRAINQVFFSAVLENAPGRLSPVLHSKDSTNEFNEEESEEAVTDSSPDSLNDPADDKSSVQDSDSASDSESVSDSELFISSTPQVLTADKVIDLLSDSEAPDTANSPLVTTGAAEAPIHKARVIKVRPGVSRKAPRLSTHQRTPLSTANRGGIAEAMQRIEEKGTARALEALVHQQVPSLTKLGLDLLGRELPDEIEHRRLRSAVLRYLSAGLWQLSGQVSVNFEDFIEGHPMYANVQASVSQDDFKPKSSTSKRRNVSDSNSSERTTLDEDDELAVHSFFSSMSSNNNKTVSKTASGSGSYTRFFGNNTGSSNSVSSTKSGSNSSYRYGGGFGNMSGGSNRFKGPNGPQRMEKTVESALVTRQFIPLVHLPKPTTRITGVLKAIGVGTSRDDYLVSIGTSIMAVMASSPGGVVICFPSYKTMRDAIDCWKRTRVQVIVPVVSEHPSFVESSNRNRGFHNTSALEALMGRVLDFPFPTVTEEPRNSGGPSDSRTTEGRKHRESLLHHLDNQHKHNQHLYSPISERDLLNYFHSVEFQFPPFPHSHISKHIKIENNPNKFKMSLVSEAINDSSSSNQMYQFSHQVAKMTIWDAMALMKHPFIEQSSQGSNSSNSSSSNSGGGGNKGNTSNSNKTQVETGEEETSDFLAAFKSSVEETERRLLAGQIVRRLAPSESDPNGRLVLAAQTGASCFAVCRGKVTEGMDLKDSACRAVVIVGVPYAPVGEPEVILKKSFQDTRASEWRAARLVMSSSDSKSSVSRPSVTGALAATPLTGDGWYQQQAFRALNQAAGRAIRHKNDYGTVVFLDSRFSERRNVSELSGWVQKVMGAVSPSGSVPSMPSGSAVVGVPPLDTRLLPSTLKDFFIKASVMAEDRELPSEK